MRLERVVAKDARRATEQVLATFGPDALIVSNQRVNGMTEIVVAIDTDGEPEAPPAREAPATARVFAPRADQQFSRSLIESLRSSTPADRAGPARAPVAGAPRAPREPDRESPASEVQDVPPFLRNLSSPPRAAGADLANGNSAEFERPVTSETISPATRLPGSELIESRAGAAPEPTDRPSSVDLSPASHQRLSSQATGPRADVHNDALALESGAVDESIDPTLDSMRARELVDLVRAELASMRQEIALSRQVENFPAGGSLNAAMQPLAGALTAAGVPIGLRTLLIDQVRDCDDLHEAVSRMKRELGSSLAALENGDRFEGIHVIAGPSGAGKTQMLCRIASRHASQHGPESVAIISFSDNRIGAWTQLQMLASRLGVDCFRVGGADLLSPMLGELGTRRLILIDTPGTGFADKLDSIRHAAPKARFNLVLPADASISGITRFIPGAPVEWHSLMVSKLDESACAWPLIQALCNHPVPLSVGSADASAEAAATVLSPADLIRQSFEQLDLPVKPAARSRTSPRSAASKRTPREARHAA